MLRPAAPSTAGPFSQRAASIGVSEKLTMSDTRIANAIVRPKLFRKRPTMPLMKATGRNTAMRDSVVASTARPMSRVASAAATNGFCLFSSMKRTMFSSTTIASSMTMPTASARARSVMMLSVKPIAHIRPNVPMIETGMASAAMSVLRAVAEEQEHHDGREERAQDEVLLDRV